MSEARPELLRSRQENLSSWQVAQLANHASKVGSGATPRGGSKIYTQSGAKFIRSQNVHFDGLRLDDMAYIPDDIHQTMQGTRVSPSDVLLNITGASIGRCAVVPPGIGEANVNQHVCIIRTTNQLDSSFLANWLSSDFGQTTIMRFQAGGNREGLNFEQIRSIEIPLPPLPEQQKIASILTSVDEVIEKIQSQINKLQDLKKATMNELLTKGIGHTEYKDSELGRIPKSWDVRNLSEISKIIDCKHKTPKYVDDGFPVLRPRDVRFEGVNLSKCVQINHDDLLDLNENHTPKIGDTIYSRNATFGIGWFVDKHDEFAIGQDLCPLVKT